MELEIQLTSGPIPAAPPPAKAPHGAWVEFRGVVRAEEGGEEIAALEYEAYPPMAEREMRRILRALAERHPCLATRVIHRVGVVPVGEAAIYVGIAGQHRTEAFALLAEFMDRLKEDVPIWKRRALTPAEFAALRPADSHSGGTPLQPAAGPPGGRSRPRGDAGAAKSADEVIGLVRELCRPLEAERVALGAAGGRVLREAVCAPEDQPAFDRSSVDGYAVRLDDPGMRFRIVDEIRAGDWKPRRLDVGEAVRVATGGALPDDGLQVLMKEDVRVEGESVVVLRRDAGRNIRFRGEDARAGQELIGSGPRLSPGGLALLASLGLTQPLVTRLPRVLHVATGNEIVAPDQPAGPGQIRDSNSTLVRAFLAQWHLVPEQLRVGEDRVAVEGALRAAVANRQSPISDPRPPTSDLRPPTSAVSPFDLVLISGGASVGEHDFTRRLLEEQGFDILVSRTTARPGKPLIVAQRDGTLAFGLPGNPLAHVVCLNLYVRAAVEAWSGQSTRSEFRRGVLATDLEGGDNPRETFWPATWDWDDGEARLTALGWSSSGDQTALAAANALLRVPAGVGWLRRGRRVEFLPV
jgi:molybdopterin molybdotransferase